MEVEVKQVLIINLINIHEPKMSVLACNSLGVYKKDYICAEYFLN